MGYFLRTQADNFAKLNYALKLIMEKLHKVETSVKEINEKLDMNEVTDPEAAGEVEKPQLSSNSFVTQRQHLEDMMRGTNDAMDAEVGENIEGTRPNRCTQRQKLESVMKDVTDTKDEGEIEEPDLPRENFVTKQQKKDKKEVADAEEEESIEEPVLPSKNSVAKRQKLERAKIVTSTPKAEQKTSIDEAKQPPEADVGPNGKKTNEKSLPDVLLTFPFHFRDFLPRLQEDLQARLGRVHATRQGHVVQALSVPLRQAVQEENVADRPPVDSLHHRLQVSLRSRFPLRAILEKPSATSARRGTDGFQVGTSSKASSINFANGQRISQRSIQQIVKTGSFVIDRRFLLGSIGIAVNEPAGGLDSRIAT